MPRKDSDDDSSSSDDDDDDLVDYSSPDDNDDGISAFTYNIQPKEFKRATSDSSKTNDATKTAYASGCTGRKRKKPKMSHLEQRLGSSGLSKKKTMAALEAKKRSQRLLDSDDDEDDDDDDDDLLFGDGSCKGDRFGVKHKAEGKKPPPPPPPPRPPKPAEPDVVITLDSDDDDDEDGNGQNDDGDGDGDGDGDEDDDDDVEIIESNVGGPPCVRRSKRQAGLAATKAGRASRAAVARKKSTSATRSIGNVKQKELGKNKKTAVADDIYGLSSSDDDSDNDQYDDLSTLKNLPPDVAAALARAKQKKDELSKAQKYHAQDYHVDVKDVPIETTARRNFFVSSRNSSNNSAAKSTGAAAITGGGVNGLSILEDDVDYGPSLKLCLREIRNKKAGAVVELMTKQKRPFSALFEKFFKTQSLEPSQTTKIVFKFDGEKLDPMKNAQQYDMEDEDMIDVEFP